MKYTVTFSPQNFAYEKQTTPAQINGFGLIGKPLEYFAIFSTKNKQDVFAQTMYEEHAKLVCLSLELTRSYLAGDGAANRDLLEKLSRLRLQ